MKNAMMKNVSREAIWFFVVTLALTALTALILPLIVVLLPALILIGSLVLWKLDQMKKRKRT